MERTLEYRLREGTSAYNAGLSNKLTKLAGDYLQSGIRNVNLHARELDALNDMVNCWNRIGTTDFNNPNADVKPIHFIHPAAATQIDTEVTYLAQILAGAKTARSVEPRGDEDEDGADMINELLQWNDDQQMTYKQTRDFIWDAVVFNRGVQYERWQPIYETEPEPVQEDDPEAEPVQAVSAKTGLPRFKKNGEPIMVMPKITRFRKRRKKVGGYNAVRPVSPYDFITDPTLPLDRLQEHRFCGHRVLIPWLELERRSKLDPTDYDYVLPAAVARLKKRKQQGNLSSMPGAPAANAALQSRSFLLRNRRGATAGGVGAFDSANKEDGGVVECFVLYIRAKPSVHGIYKEDTEPEIIEFLMGGEKELLSCNVQPNKHDEYPYAVAEARPNCHMQFSPGVAAVIQGPQAHIDDLNWRHTEHLARAGVIILADGTKVELSDFIEDTGRIRQVIMTKEGASGTPLSECATTFNVDDPTKDFPGEMDLWTKIMEQATGAPAYVQGIKEGPDTTATEFNGIQEMASGRVSSIARMISEQALQPQVRRMVCNFQQFLPDEVSIRIRGDSDDFDPDKPAERQKNIIRDRSAFPPDDPRAQAPADIQCNFDVVPHDGSLPSAETQKIAALMKIVETFSSQPVLAPVLFDQKIPGSWDIKKLFATAVRLTGIKVNNYRITRETAQKNLAAEMLAQGVQPPPQPGTEQTIAPIPQGAPGTIPFPQVESAAAPAPQVTPMTV
jgi:hypothetical protein